MLEIADLIINDYNKDIESKSGIDAHGELIHVTDHDRLQSAQPPNAIER
jgi:hypothetical protein